MNYILNLNLPELGPNYVAELNLNNSSQSLGLTTTFKLNYLNVSTNASTSYPSFTCAKMPS